VYTPETSRMKGTPVHIENMWIKQLCNHFLSIYALIVIHTTCNTGTTTNYRSDNYLQQFEYNRLLTLLNNTVQLQNLLYKTIHLPFLSYDTNTYTTYFLYYIVSSVSSVIMRSEILPWLSRCENVWEPSRSTAEVQACVG